MAELADPESFVHEYLVLIRDDDGGHLHCASCRFRLCDVSENYRLAARVVASRLFASVARKKTHTKVRPTVAMRTPTNVRPV